MKNVVRFASSGILALVIMLSAIGAPITSARALPATVVPCGQAVLLDQLAYTPPTEHQTYNVSFDVQGVGFALTQVTPWYSYVWTDVNSPDSVTHFSYQVEADRYPGRPTEVQIEGDAAPCSQYPSGMTFSNVQIAPVSFRSSKASDY